MPDGFLEFGSGLGLDAWVQRYCVKEGEEEGCCLILMISFDSGMLAVWTFG